MKQTSILVFLGGAREVGRTSMLLKLEDMNILLDCGINIGVKGENRYPIPPPEKPDVAVVSHAHLDHSGYIPVIARKYGCKIYATPPTQDISEILHMDLLKIAKEYNETPPFEVKDVMALRKYFIDSSYRTPLVLEKDIHLTMYRSGHILGSAMIKIETDTLSILYTGDLSMRNSKTLEMADIDVGKVDILIIESTYGHFSDKHPSRQKTEQEFIRTIKRTIKRGGKVLIPAFAVGRAQEVMLTLESHMRSKALTSVPIYIDGMIKKINELYRMYWFYLRPQIRRAVRYAKRNPLESKLFTIVKDRDEPVEREEPCIIISTSGMLEGGPAIFYLKELGTNPKNLICLTGYQVPGTRGRRLLDGERRIELPKEGPIEVLAEVKMFDFSAHADQPSLFRFISYLRGLKKVFCVHGEEVKVLDFSERIKKNKKIEAHAPKVGEEVLL